jgi:hypothetical protein
LAAADQCFTQCIAGDAKAKEIDAQNVACLSKCGDNDQACGQKCFDATQPACATSQKSCDLLDSCDTKCYGAPPAGAGGK